MFIDEVLAFVNVSIKELKQRRRQRLEKRVRRLKNDLYFSNKFRE